MKPNNAATFALAPALLVSLVVGCASPPPPPPAEPEPAPVRVENPELGLAYADLTEGFTVAENAGDQLRLQHASGGEVWIVVAPEQRAGVNLIKEVNAWKQRYDEMPGGQFLGQVELGSPMGVTYSVRGRFTGEGGQEVEERRMLCLYHTGNRLMEVIYRYPPGDDQNTRVRSEQLFAQFGELEAYYPDAEGAGAGTGETDSGETDSGETDRAEAEATGE